MLKEEDIVNEGFKPLKKTATEPVQLQGKPSSSRGLSFFKGEDRENSQSLWQESQWSKLEKSRGKLYDRSNSFFEVGRSRTNTIDVNSGKPQAVVVVDPFSTGAHLASEIVKLGFKCVRVLSIWDSPVAALVQEGVVVEFDATIQHNDTVNDKEQALEQTIQSLKSLPFTIIALIPGAETGVELADQLSSRLGLRSNGEQSSLPRRNKYLMGEKVRASGVRAVKQRQCTSLSDVREFVDDLLTIHDVLKCVVKPVQSAGTDDVFLCQTYEEAEVAFKRIYKKVNGLGLINESVLVQEFLYGNEYVVDQVSRDGVHKIVAIWEYDKRQVNHANFVYFGMKLISSTTEMAKQLKQYADQVLNALEIVNGPSHMEVMYNPKTGPCLVEVGARCQGGEGTWLPVAKECVGYTQVQVTLDVYIDGNLFDKINANHYPLYKSGRDVDLVSRFGGVVRGFPGDSLIRALPSFRSLSWEAKVGEFQPTTIDCFTRPGCAQLVHESEEQIDKDFEFIHSLESNGLIDYSVICPTPPQPGAVVVVDPFSTGANIAATIIKMGYRLILVFSELNSPVAKLVSKSSSYQPTLLIQHDNTNPDQQQAISHTLDAIHKAGSCVLAILPGAETGVELADKLAARYGTRNNGEEMTEARRNKFLMQEAIRKAGVRSISQKLCRSEEEVISFYKSLPSTPGKCVIKPNMSAGTDNVNLCDSLDKSLAAFHSISGHCNGLGHVNDGALCQEFLSGIEYVVDGVSRDGIYKVIAIWQYDKRSVNGANFVYFGMRLMPGHGLVEQKLIDYAAKVVKALGILHGPSHMEVMYDDVTGPCLVEVGARCQGGEGTWLPVAQECIGYTQLDATLNCYLRPDQFDNLPPYPKLLKRGAEAFFVSFSTGVVTDIPGIDKIRQLPSFRRIEMLTQPGATIYPTIDCFTRPGSVQLVNEDLNQLEEDYNAIRLLEKDGLFLLS